MSLVLSAYHIYDDGVGGVGSVVVLFHFYSSSVDDIFHFEHFNLSFSDYTVLALICFHVFTFGGFIFWLYAVFSC